VVYYFPINGNHDETGDVYPVRLKEDGTADLSELPDDIRSSLKSFGIRNELRTRDLFPKDGKLFLQALIASANGYRRFRLSPMSTAKVRDRHAKIIPFRRPSRPR
jgi:hypothetical protein